MKLAEKCKGRVSNMFDVKQNTTDKRPTKPSVLSVPTGYRWSNNSCTYHAVLFVLYNTWHLNDTSHSVDFTELRNHWINIATLAFKKHTLGEYTLEEVRDYLRRALHREYPSQFIFGQNMSVEALMMRLLHTGDTFSTDDYNLSVSMWTDYTDFYATMLLSVSAFNCSVTMEDTITVLR